MKMFKVGDKVKRIRDDYYNTICGKVYTVRIQDGYHLFLMEVEGNYDTKAFELVEEEKPVSTNPVGSANPCITTEEVKIVKTRFTRGRLEIESSRNGMLGVFDLRPSNRNGEVFMDMSFCEGRGSVSADSLRKLARQLDEIANVLETKE